MRPAGLTLRRARPVDAATIARTTALGVETYRAFAPAGWSPLPLHVESLVETLAQPTSWALIAEVAGEPAGHVSMVRDRHRDETAYLSTLFVRPAWWGRGLADELHEAFIVEARARGRRDGRLHTPAAHARARRFYERRGWRRTMPLETWNGLPVLEYRRALGE